MTKGMQASEGAMSSKMDFSAGSRESQPSTLAHSIRVGKFNDPTLARCY